MSSTTIRITYIWLQRLPSEGAVTVGHRFPVCPVMELVQKEHDRLSKKIKAGQGIKNVQSTIDLLQSARDAIAAGACASSDVARV